MTPDPGGALGATAATGGGTLRSAAGAGGRLAVALPLLLLVTMAGLHTTLRLTTELTPWKGGGFAMFSSIDGPAIRQVRLSVQTDDGAWVDAVAPAGYRDDLDLLRAVSSRDGAEALATRAVTESWYRAGGPAVASSVTGGPQPGLTALEVTAARVEVLHPDYDPSTGRLALRTVHDVVVPPGEVTP